MTKPRIHRCQPYDGDGWLCYDLTTMGWGVTPGLAYRAWLSNR